MTTINGKDIPSHYRSLTDLPGIITEMEQYGDCSDRNGNLDKNEALCVVNYVGDEMITVDDYQLAQAHSGLSSLIDMTPRQFKDLCYYFGETFEGFLPYVEYQKDDGDGSLVSRKGISISAKKGLHINDQHPTDVEKSRLDEEIESSDPTAGDGMIAYRGLIANGKPDPELLEYLQDVCRRARLKDPTRVTPSTRAVMAEDSLAGTNLIDEYLPEDLPRTFVIDCMQAD